MLGAYIHIKKCEKKVKMYYIIRARNIKYCVENDQNMHQNIKLEQIFYFFFLTKND